MPDIVTTAKNEYAICLNYAGQPPIPWDLYGPAPNDAPDYFRRVFLAMEQHLSISNLQFYLTWKLEELPTTGSDVVAVVLGDEWSRIPAYVDDILITFKCYGTRPPLDLGVRPNQLNAMRLLKQVRTLAHFLPGWVSSTARRTTGALRGQQASPIHSIPLGYGNQLDLPIRPMTERSIDVFFAGSVEHGHDQGLKQWIESPKTLSRQQMLNNLDELASGRPDLRVALSTPTTFAWNAIHYGQDAGAQVLDAESYSAKMMDSKICLVPRGTSLETFRYFEALRYGCVLITEQLPQRWFYNNSPAFQVESWSELPNLIDRLVSNPGLLHQKHREALDYWQNVCSPERAGHFMAERIQEAVSHR